MTSIRDSLAFLREYLRHPLQIGALAPSSHALAKVMIDAAGVRDAASIVELGSGTGIFTEHIEKAKKSSASFCVFEINDKFVRQTRDRCPDVTIYQESASKLPKHMNYRQLTQAVSLQGKLRLSGILPTLVLNVFPDRLPVNANRRHEVTA